MTKAMKQSLAVIAVIAQLLILLPFSIISVNAEESASIDDSQPVLNETVVGTVKFQSFNFLGDNETGSDGVDYETTYYYSDDYFSSSAINPTADSKSEDWTELTDNELSLASASFDLTVAAYASNDNNVLNDTNPSWDNTYYPGKDKNAKAMLEECGFENFESYGTYDQAPINDSIAYVIASKKIKVWDEYSQANKEFSLIAVAVRGAGYGAEWASNVTIGDKNTNKLPANGRHSGFDEAAKEVCSGIQSYISDHNISRDAKYWITGFSRAGATANLVAGYVTDNAESAYHTHQRDVYGYTWECPQGASTSEDALAYKNIHNIINAMDAVPKVSPSKFNHQRLGVDYVMPYYQNAGPDNEKYYTNMREVLQTIAVGAYNYAGEAYTQDPLISATHPDNYPYNRPMTIYTIKPTQLISDALNDRLMENFGTSSVSGNDNKLGPNIYIDTFIDNLIDVFLKSKAWIGEIGGTRSELLNRTTFIEKYQQDFRNVLGYLLDYSGPAFLGMVDALVDAVGKQLSLSNTATNAGLGLAFLNFYEYPTSTYKWGVPPFIDPWVGKPSWAGNTRRAVLVDEAQPVVKNVIRKMVGSFVDPQGITRTQFEDSMDDLVELVVNLYADELSKYNSNYFGTSLHYMWQILCTHEQEVVMSWIMSLDPNHMNRSYRTLEVPKDSIVELYEYRPQFAETQYDGTIEGKGPGICVAKCSNGNFVKIKNPMGTEVDSLDQRIYVTDSDNKMIIRYPSSLDVRADVKSTEDVDDLEFQVADYQTASATKDISAGESQYQRVTGPTSIYTDITNTNKTNAKTINDYNTLTIPMSTRDILHVYSKGTETYNEVGQPYSIDKDIYTNVVVEGQFVRDGDDPLFESSITDDNGNEVTLEEQANKFVYSSQYGNNLRAIEEKSHLGHDFTITVPRVMNDHYVEKYFVTNASGVYNDRLSRDGVPYEDENMQQGPVNELSSKKTQNVQQVLGLTDEVFHVFYSGTAAAPKTITKIIDFNGKMILATQADEPTDKIEENGTFNWDNSSKNATYQLTTQKRSDEEVTLTSAYETADQAVIKGVFESGSRPVKKKVTVVPANNIYFNDGLSDQVLQSGDGSGFNDDAGTKYQANMYPVDANGAVAYYFTFSGTAIDVYCTTDTESGYISAAVFKGAGSDVCKREYRIGTAKTIKNMSSTSYLSTPTLHFKPSTGFGTYTLKISVMNGANYKLDGVRVYGSTKNMEQELYGEERNATFANLREALANESEAFSFTTDLTSEGTADTIDMEKDVSKILFLDNATELLSTSINGDRIYNTTFEAYQKAGPKSEIFLAENQGIVFSIKNYAALIANNPDMKFMVGLRLPENSDSQADVLLGEENQTIKSHLDMFYEITPTADGVFTIVNKSDVLVSVTTLKTSGTEAPIEFSTDASEPSGTDTYSANALSFSVSPNTLRLAAKQMNLMPEGISEEQTGNDSDTTVEDPKESEIPDDGSPVINEPEETATPTPTPSVTPDTPAETGNTIQKVIQSITKTISSFFKSIFRR